MKKKKFRIIQEKERDIAVERKREREREKEREREYLVVFLSAEQMVRQMI